MLSELTFDYGRRLSAIAQRDSSEWIIFTSWNWKCNILLMPFSVELEAKTRELHCMNSEFIFFFLCWNFDSFDTHERANEEAEVKRWWIRPSNAYQRTRKIVNEINANLISNGNLFSVIGRGSIDAKWIVDERRRLKMQTNLRTLFPCFD